MLAELFLRPLFSLADTLLLELDLGRVNMLSASPGNQKLCYAVKFIFFRSTGVMPSNLIIESRVKMATKSSDVMIRVVLKVFRHTDSHIAFKFIFFGSTGVMPSYHILPGIDCDLTMSSEARDSLLA